MSHTALSNPFALLMDPAIALQALERLERNGPRGRICRPLDRPVLGSGGAESADEAEHTPEREGDAA